MTTAAHRPRPAPSAPAFGTPLQARSRSTHDGATLRLNLPCRAARLLVAAAVPLLLGGCAGTGYYWQSVQGHLRLMEAARPVDDWLADPGTSAALKARLQLAQRIRAFASREVGLPDNASYRRFSRLGRTAAVWNVVAAPPLSLTLHTWCFPVTGCVGYRGYYAEADARAEAEALRRQGLETVVYGVPAYSTLGWLNWAGGDPLLDTFIGYPDGELARLVFHELAHQVVFVPGDTMFNESFATAVERIGRDRWLATEATPAAREAWARHAQRAQDFRALVSETRRRLQAIYEGNGAPAPDPAAQLAMKNEAMQQFRAAYAALRERWGGDAAAVAGYDAWVARANNAAFGAQAAYDAWVPAFEALFARAEAAAPADPWPAFYADVRRLAALPAPARRAALAAAAPDAVIPATR
ncbi:aminopeptidase [uncultured Xylophilus sp.]|uniref:aminopeptidase n=1 Tax=uncultured Xylophilus sp. TaxID=296832 RepID=UPI0025D2885F|nr:aminopeptidase [uncultured Xylophilus sp.]